MEDELKKEIEQDHFFDQMERAYGHDIRACIRKYKKGRGNIFLYNAGRLVAEISINFKDKPHLTEQYLDMFKEEHPDYVELLEKSIQCFNEYKKEEQ